MGGAYKIVEHMAGQRLVLEAHDGFAGPKPHFRRVEILPITDSKAAENAVEAGQVDWTRVSLSIVPKLRANLPENLSLELKYAPDNVWMGLNQASPRLSDIRVRQAILKAKSANMPQDNIKRAIKKGTGDLPGMSYEEAVYEGYAPGGVAVLMEVLTDNKNRTVADIRHIMTKHGGNLGENGSVSWMFNKIGEIILDLSAGDEETVMEAVLESGAEDLEIDEKYYIISTEPNTLMSVRDRLENNGYEIK